MSTFYLTTPIYYVNALPHIGHIYTTVVGDTLARFRRMAGQEVYFLTGTDEHGQNIERAADREGIAPIALADRVVERYHELWREFDISHDDFIRTTEARHATGVAEIIRRIDAAGDFYVAPHEGWYCSPCETFYTEKELVGGERCPVHELPVERKREENLFFRLSKYQDRLLAWYDRPEQPVRPATRANEVRTFVASGLRDLSVSRANLSWGIPFPGHPGQTIYVWLDALTNYISALGFGREGQDLYRRFWEPGGAERVHLVGKDILRHHAVYWPAFLMSAGLPLPTTVWAHGFWLRDQRKISKSAGNIVRPDDLVERFGPDPLRYFLLRDMVFGQDSTFSDEAFVERYNSDLANDLGNTVSRVVTLARKAFGGRTPPESCGDNPLIAVAAEVAKEYRAAMEEPAMHRALESLWRLLAETNGYIVAREPWKLIREEGERSRLSRILWNGLEALRIVATGLLPVMPKTAAAVLAAVGTRQVPASLDAMAWGGTPTGVELPEPVPLFPRIDKDAYLAPAEGAGKEKKTVDENQTAPAQEIPEEAAVAKKAAGDTPGEKPGGKAAEQPAEQPAEVSIDQFFATQLRVGTVLAAEAIPKSKKLLKLSIDLGEAEPRTLVAGIALAYQPEALVGRQVVVVANLQPAKLMGVTSQGMVLAASVDGEPVLLHPGKAVPNGTRVR